jgi:hypothetical protein
MEYVGDAVAALDVALTPAEVSALGERYQPRLMSSF